MGKPESCVYLVIRPSLRAGRGRGAQTFKEGEISGIMKDITI
jgi:hypothetical protein